MNDCSRILLSIPNWVGDVVMATPALRAVRRRFGDAQITHLMRPYVAEALAGTAFGDENVFWPTPPQRHGLAAHVGLIRQLRQRQYDLAILLTNSFRSAAVVKLAGVRRIVGYARDGRGWLLTDRLYPPRAGGEFVPIPALDYYNALARHVGCDDPGDQLELGTTPSDEAAVDARLGRSDSSRLLVVLNPGANYGSAKCWPAEYYAALSDTIVRRYGARVVASLGPKERDIAERLRAAAREPIDVFNDPPLGLGPLKALVRRCDLLVTNDTGPRHFAAAFGVPVVTVFGSSDPAWTETRFAKERIVSLKLDCQPCMERTCPLEHHNCMKALPPERVMEEIVQSLADRPERAGKAAPTACIRGSGPC